MKERKTTKITKEFEISIYTLWKIVKRNYSKAWFGVKIEDRDLFAEDIDNDRFDLNTVKLLILVLIRDIKDKKYKYNLDEWTRSKYRWIVSKLTEKFEVNQDKK